MDSLLRTAWGLARRGHWNLFAAKTLRVLRLRRLLAAMTVRLDVPGEPWTRSLRMGVSLGDWISDDIARHGVWEPVLTSELIPRAQKGGLLVDVGANVGYFSLLWAAARPDNRVYAFEASPRILPHLVRNLRRNALGDRVEVSPLAMSDHEGRAPFWLGPEEQTGWGGLTPLDASVQIDVQCARLDSQFPVSGRIAVLKVDAEGADDRVLRGASTLIEQRSMDAIYFEHNRDRNPDRSPAPGLVGSWLHDCGYRVSRIEDPLDQDPDGSISEWKALRK